MKLFAYIVFTTYFCCLAGTARAAETAEIKVIANPSVQEATISADALKDVFLLMTTSLKNGDHVEPVVLKSGAAHELFRKDYLKKTQSALETYYRSLVFSGKGTMPKALATDAEVEAYVARTKGAIGYVSAMSPGAAVKVLEIK